MKIRRETKGNIGKNRPGGSRVKMTGKSTRNYPPQERDRNCCNEAKEKAENRDGDSNCSGHGFHLKIHGWLELGALPLTHSAQLVGRENDRGGRSEEIEKIHSPEYSVSSDKD